MKKIEKLLKSNSIINKLYSFFGSLVVKFIGLFVSVEKNSILFVSYSGKNFNDSPKEIYDYLISHEEYKDKYKMTWAFKDVDKFEVSLGTEKIKIDTFKYLILALKSEYWVTNVNIERGLHFKKKYTKYVNTWHGIPIKKIGNHVKGRNDFDFYTVDLFCYSGAYEKDIYKEAFRLNDDNLRMYGMPRNDRLLTDGTQVCESVRAQLKIEQDKKIILFAPTWRDDPNDLVLMDFKKWEEKLSDRYVLLVKMHGLSDQVDLNSTQFVRDVSDFEDTTSLLLATDLLISDYSSIMFDYALLGRPILVYAPDLEKYTLERGTYFNIDEVNLSTFKDQEVLMDYISELDATQESVNAVEFCDRFNQTREGNATREVVEEIFGKGE